MRMETSTNMVDLYKCLGPSCAMGYEQRASAAASRPVTWRTSAIHFANLLSRWVANVFHILVLGVKVSLARPSLHGLQHNTELRAVNANTPGMSKIVVAGSACVATNMVKTDRKVASATATGTP